MSDNFIGNHSHDGFRLSAKLWGLRRHELREGPGCAGKSQPALVTLKGLGRERKAERRAGGWAREVGLIPAVKGRKPGAKRAYELFMVHLSQGCGG